MAVSNQIRTSAKAAKRAGMPASASPQEETRGAASGLDRIGISAAEALKSKKIKNLSLKGVSNYYTPTSYNQFARLVRASLGRD